MRGGNRNAGVQSWVSGRKKRRQVPKAEVPEERVAG